MHARRPALVALGLVLLMSAVSAQPQVEVHPGWRLIPDAIYPLDPILEAFIEADCSVDQIVERGYDRQVVGRILGMVKRNEYKRRQAPPGIRISRRAFGRDWRYPITSGYRFSS